MLAACQDLATTLANVQAVPVAEVWTYEAWVWESSPNPQHCEAWGRDLKTLAANLVHQLEVSQTRALTGQQALTPHQLEPSAYDAFLGRMLAAWAVLDEDEATPFSELGSLLPMARLLVRSHRLIGIAHKRLNAVLPCRKGLAQVRSSYILPVITNMIHDLVTAASHLAGPSHTAPDGEWRATVEQELRRELEQEYRDRLRLETSDSFLLVFDSGTESGSEGYVTPTASPAASPGRRLAVGGPAGMFSPPGTLDEDQLGGAARPSTTVGGLPRTPVPQRRGLGPEGLSSKASKAKPRLKPDAQQEAEAMAASDLFGSPAVGAVVEPAQDRISSLEAKVSQLTDAVNLLLAVAKDLRGHAPSGESKPQSQGHGMEGGMGGQPASEERTREDELPPAPRQSSPADEVTVLKLRQDRRKERQSVLKVLLPWAKHLAVLPDRTTLLKPALHRLYGPPTYFNAGEVGALEDAVKMYRAMAYPAVASDTAATSLTFQFTAAVAVGLVFFRVGGPLRDDEPLYLRTMDFIPLADGEDRRLAHVNEGMFTTEPVWAHRRPPSTMASFRDCGLRLAVFLGLHWGPRCRHELSITVEILHDKGSRSPSVMTPTMACHLLDLLVLSVVEAVYEAAKGGTPLPVGTDPLSPTQCAFYRERGWCTEGPTFLASLDSAFMRRWWYEPLQEAALSDPSRRGTAMRLMGMDLPKPPKGGPTGGGPLPEATNPSPPPVQRTKANFTVEDAVAAASCLPGSRAFTDQVCMRYLSAKGCQRGPKCRFLHVSVTTAQLADCSRKNPTLQRILAFFGGPSPRNLTSQPTQASTSATPQAGRSGGQSASDSDDSSTGERELPGPLASGGKASGGIDVQVPYLLALGGCYRRAPLNDARSSPPAESVVRPPTTHPDAPLRPFYGAADLYGVSPPALAPLRAGSQPPDQAVVVTPTRSDGGFSVCLGSLVIPGQDAGQELVVGTHVVTNACVVLSFARILDVPPVDLFSFLVSEAQSAASQLGPPSRAETATTTLLRAFCHDILASCQRGHPLDALVFLYFPHPALLRAVVVVVHVSGSSVAIDVVRGPLAVPSSPLLGCLQRRGTPGHMQPLSLPPFTLSDLHEWAHRHHLSFRLLEVQPWQAWLATDPTGPSVRWDEHATCDFCHLPRFPLPPATL